MSPLSVEPETLDETLQAKPAPQITYESAAAPISRRQFRLLFLLTLLNTALLGIFVAGPGISRITSGWWQDYKNWQADRLAARQKVQAEQKFAADYQAALQFTAPENQVVYEEDTQRAARLLASGSDYAVIRSSEYVYFTPAPWQLPVMRKSNALPLPFQSTQEATVFLHSRKTPAGIERVVYVELAAKQDIRPSSATDAGRHFWISNERMLFARSYEAKTDSTLRPNYQRSLNIVQPTDKCTTITWTKGEGNTWEDGHIDAKPNNVLRIFAGRPDPIDTTHFTIAYELDGKPGIIDGWLLKDETVALQPRQGRIIKDNGTGRERHWDPYATSPATRPIVAPDLTPAPSRWNALSDR